uniref:Uncharacterized protein n=1 Tax=Craspedostauros australis TaxID=1486917 RepID=A0A7R9WPV5_9STRA
MNGGPPQGSGMQQYRQGPGNPGALQSLQQIQQQQQQLQNLIVQTQQRNQGLQQQTHQQQQQQQMPMGNMGQGPPQNMQSAGAPQQQQAQIQGLPIRAYLDQTVVPILLDGKPSSSFVMLISSTRRGWRQSLHDRGCLPCPTSCCPSLVHTSAPFVSPRAHLFLACDYM